MSVSKTTYFAIGQAAPTQLAEAAASAMETANGEGRSFAVKGISYNLPGKIRFKNDSPKLADIKALASFPEGFDLFIASSSPDANIDFVNFDLREDQLCVIVNAKTPEALSSFLDAFSVAFDSQEVESRSEEFHRRIMGEHRESSHAEDLPRAARSTEISTADSGPHILIFTALQEEREMLERALGLETAYEDGVARGTRNGVAVELLSARFMGRVPAAVTVAAHLASARKRFQLIVLAGIAGGFSRAQVQHGAVVIANEVVDLAMRKQFDDGPEFRPKVYATDDAIERFTKSHPFRSCGWDQMLANADHWPKGRLPYILYGPLASMDEIVSSDHWQAELIGAWPKLLGVEMEAGGVCAAAERFGHKVAVIRGISDLADPRKSDDEWRHRAMHAVVTVIDSMLSSGVLSATASVA